jgi:hypothetical protein
MAAELEAPFAGMANAARLRKFVLRSAQMLLIGGGLSGCAIPLRVGLVSQEGRLTSPSQIMLAQSTTAQSDSLARAACSVPSEATRKKDA